VESDHGAMSLPSHAGDGVLSPPSHAGDGIADDHAKVTHGLIC
jgi:hypothetical protein